MSFNKKFIKPLKEVEAEFKEKGMDSFVQSYIKADAFIGPADSIRFIESKIEEHCKES